MLNAEITSDNHIFTPLKKFPETFSEEERYIISIAYTFMHVIPNSQICIVHLHEHSGPYLIFGSLKKGPYWKQQTGYSGCFFNFGISELCKLVQTRDLIF